MERRPFYFNLHSGIKELCLEIIVCIVFFASCSINPDSENVSFYLPEWPPAFGKSELYPEVVEWIVEMEGENRSLVFELDGSFDSNKPCLCLNLQKNETVCITAVPVTEMCGEKVQFFKCAGALYPHNRKVTTTFDVKNQMDWENGYAAYVMQRIILTGRKNGFTEWQIGKFIENFNWRKFQQVVEEKTLNAKESFFNLESEEVTTTSNVIFYNPWMCDLENVLEQIAYNTFSASAVNMKSVFSSQQTDYKHILSSYIPENEVINNYGYLCLKSKEENLFSVYNSYGLIFEGTSAKKVSIEQCLLPIYIEEYENK